MLFATSGPEGLRARRVLSEGNPGATTAHRGHIRPLIALELTYEHSLTFRY